MLNVLSKRAEIWFVVIWFDVSDQNMFIAKSGYFMYIYIYTGKQEKGEHIDKNN